MKYVITGGCGFIGANIAEKITNTELDSEVLVVDSLKYDTMHYVRGRCNKVLTCDITKNRNAIEKHTKGFDVMIHLAANTGVIPSVERPLYDAEQNVMGTVNCLEACRANNIKKFIYASSGAVLGEQTPPLHEEMLPKPISPYGVSKLAGENYCRAYSETYGLENIAFRFSNVYGPYSMHKNSLVAKFIKAILREEKYFPIYGDGKQTRDFIYVDDVVKAILMAAKSDIKNEVFQLSTFREYSVLEIVEMLNDFAREKKLSYKFEDERAGEVRKSYANNSKIKDVLGFEPVWSIEKGLNVTFDWFSVKDYLRKSKP